MPAAQHAAPSLLPPASETLHTNGNALIPRKISPSSPKSRHAKATLLASRDWIKPSELSDVVKRYGRCRTDAAGAVTKPGPSLEGVMYFCDGWV
jgi:hypothetical protein